MNKNKPSAPRKLIEQIGPGDRVTILIPAGIGRNGQEWTQKTGRAVMPGPAGWVLDMGGRYGIPGIAGDDNTVKVVKRGAYRRRATKVKT